MKNVYAFIFISILLTFFLWACNSSPTQNKTSTVSTNTPYVQDNISQNYLRNINDDLSDLRKKILSLENEISDLRKQIASLQSQHQNDIGDLRGYVNQIASRQR